MYKEVLDAAVKLGKEQKLPQLVPYDPRKAVAFINEQGVLEVKGPEKGPIRRHQPYSLGSFADYVARWSPANVVLGTDEPQAGIAQSVWYNRGEIVFFQDDVARQDRVAVDLEPSHQLKVILEWPGESGVKGGWYTSPALIRLLRVDLKGCYDNAARLIDLIRVVLWKQEQEKQVEAPRGKTSVGTKIETQMKNIDQLPEYITFRVPMFDGHVHSVQSIECALELDEASCKFGLLPIPGQIEAACEAAEEEIANTLGSLLPEGTNVFYGDPHGD